LTVDAQAVELSVALESDPPPPLEVQVVLALPRPKFVRRSLSALTSLGVKRIHLVNALRVEKSYWQSEELLEENVRAACIKGLEQARDTVLPEVTLHPRFRPFVEDELPALIAGGRALVADVHAREPCPANLAGHVTVAVGPEGGFIPYEVELLGSVGFAPVGLGARALTVETALAALLGRVANFSR
jgi:RsmE family RNA methyltransferase